MMNFNVIVLFEGFSGKLSEGYLGLGTWALIKSPQHNILLDTGFVGLRKDFDKILLRNNLLPQDIDYVLLTHLHFDHCCNVDLVPNATFVLSRREWETANDENNDDRFIEKSAVQFLRNAKKILVEDGDTIFPGLTAILVPGHTPGSCAYVLQQPDGQRWILAGDAVKNKGELLSGSVQLSKDPAASAASIEKNKTAGANRILPGHSAWISVKDDGQIAYESLSQKTLVFGQSVTVNGQTQITLTMDP